MAITGATGSVQIQGLRQFRTALAQVGSGFSDILRAANIAAAQSLVDAAKSSAEAQGSTAAKASQSLRASRSAASAAVLLGGGSFPFALGAEFGAKQYKQFKPWLGNQFEGWAGGPGYFLFPSLRKEGPAIVEAYFTKVDALIDVAFPDP